MCFALFWQAGRKDAGKNALLTILIPGVQMKRPIKDPVMATTIPVIFQGCLCVDDASKPGGFRSLAALLQRELFVVYIINYLMAVVIR